MEAALVLPFFLAFVLAMASVIKLSVTDLALQRALTETAKPIAAYAYPAELLAVEAREAYANSKVGGVVADIIDRVSGARDKVVQGEQLVEQYEAFIPDFMLSLVEWEQQKRELLERLPQDQADAFIESQINPAIRALFRKLVMQAADSHALTEKRLRIVSVHLPKLGSAEEAFIGLTAEYEVILPVPFFRKTITLRKQAYERLWVGS